MTATAHLPPVTPSVQVGKIGPLAHDSRKSAIVKQSLLGPRLFQRRVSLATSKQT